ncbi:MAG TPA: hypothetical protein ENK57_17080 [Polyangiaceae bacterium]|nr:hypothetical protein [Polyangiaceae bacterium]
MSMHAIAVVQVKKAVLFDALREGAEANTRVAANGEAVRVDTLSNAVLVHLGIPLTEAPEVLGARLASLLGDLLAAHTDPRGVPVYPESYSLSAASWDDALRELGDGADWVPVRAAAPAMPDLAALLAGGMPGGGMHGDPMAALAQLAGGDGASLMQQAMQMVGQLAESGALEGLAAQMSAIGSPEDALQQMGVAPEALGGLSLSGMAEQAKEMLKQNPALAQRIESQLGALGNTEEE